MSEELPLFRFQMGEHNAHFESARAEQLVVKHTPVDFYERYVAGDEQALRQEFKRIFYARFPEFNGDLPTGWETRYINDALRFFNVPQLRVITNYKDDLYWSETTKLANAWKRTTAGQDEIACTFDLVARRLDRPWQRETLNGTPLRDLMHPKAWRSFSINRAEMGQANAELTAYFDAVLNQRDLTGWHTKPEWIADAAQDYRKRRRVGAVTGPADMLHAYIETQKLTYEAVRNGETAGVVYAISADEHPNWLKVGFTTDMEARMAALQTGNPYALKLRCSRETPVAGFAEACAHDYLRNHHRGIGEWFKITLPQAEDAIAYGVGATAKALESVNAEVKVARSRKCG